MENKEINIYEKLIEYIKRNTFNSQYLKGLLEYSRDEVISLSTDEVRDSFINVLLLPEPSLFFNILKDANLLDIHYPEITRLVGAIQPKNYHPEGDSYNHTMLVLDYACRETEKIPDNRKLEIRFSALVHDFGKGVTPKEEYPHHYKHEINGIPVISEFCKRLNLPANFEECGIVSSREHMRGGIFDSMKPSTKVSFIESIAETGLGLDGLQMVVNADRLSNSHLFTDNGYSRVNFETPGKMLMSEINENSVREKCGITDVEKLKEKMHQLRIDYIKQIMKK